MTKKSFQEIAHQGKSVPVFEYMFDYVKERKGISITHKQYYEIERTFPNWSQEVTDYYSLKFNVAVVIIPQQLAKELKAKKARYDSLIK